MKSPCIEVCMFDRPTGWCYGCGRTLEECRAWKKAQPYRLRAITADLPRRLERLRAKAAVAAEPSRS
jgi:predicted Fe-S protein YdhL (DUF1289 family)